MSESEMLAWAAGFFEGEGTISLSSRGRWAVQIQQNNRESLDRIKSVLGGSVMGPYRRVRNTTQKINKPYWVWRASASEKLSILVRLEPLLIEKRSKASQAIAMMNRDS